MFARKSRRTGDAPQMRFKRVETEVSGVEKPPGPALAHLLVGMPGWRATLVGLKPPGTALVTMLVSFIFHSLLTFNKAYPIFPPILSPTDRHRKYHCLGNLRLSDA